MLHLSILPHMGIAAGQQLLSQQSQLSPLTRHVLFKKTFDGIRQKRDPGKTIL